MEYYVVMQDYGKRGLEAVVHPENTYRKTVEMVVKRDYKDIVFIHHIKDGIVTDVTEDILAAAGDPDAVLI